MEKTIAIGVDIGGTHITCAAVSLQDGRLLEDTLSRAACSHEAPADQILNAWVGALNRTIRLVGDVQLAGIGFAIPGPFDYRNGISKMQHKFKNLYGLNIPAALNGLLSVNGQLPMRFMNDATAFGAGEAWKGRGQGFKNVIALTLGTGFGSAFFEDGVPVIAGEGVPPEGCLWHLPFKDSIADDYFSTKWFDGVYQKHYGKKLDGGVKTLMDQVEKDTDIQLIFTTFGNNLAECLSPWLQQFGTEMIVAGGNISHALPYFENAFHDNLDKKGWDTPLMSSLLLESAALFGSARLLDDIFWEKVKIHLPNI